MLVDRSITCIESQAVVEATKDSVVLSDGRSVAADVICAATPVHPPGWILDSELPTEQGFLAVNNFLQVQKQQALFAAGDIVSLASLRGRSGVMAVRAGQYLADAIWKRLHGITPRRFRPQKRWLTLLNLGNGSAIAVKGRLAVESPHLFRLKDWIDRRFMQRFKAQIMQAERSMRCEGCAAKLSGQILQTVFSGAFEDAAIENLSGVIRVRSIDALSYLVDDPYVMGILSVRHAVSDIWAMGGRPVQCLSLIGVQRANNEHLEADEFQQCLNGIKDAAESYEVTLSGGHSLALDQPVVAISIEGEAERLISKQGARLGDEVWLTGPIGSGVLFAAQAAGQPVGQAIDRWLQLAPESLFEASQVASELGVHAMTDVTGFGLAGHLKEMLDGSEFSLAWADSIDMFEGVSASLARGIRSSAHHENQIYAGRFGERAPNPVVFDPQTCGPLMVAVCPIEASTLINQWMALGLSPQLVGHITTETS
jgi:selenide,water dikinase